MERNTFMTLEVNSSSLTIALPSDGDLYLSSIEFFNACNLGIKRASSRRYTGAISGLENSTVIFQRTSDIASKVDDGIAELGITGLDKYMESGVADSNSLIIFEDLGYGGCELVLAVPLAWIDVSNMRDLADVALEFRQRGIQLRIATKYPRLVQRYLLDHGISYFVLVGASGTLEAAPTVGYADIIADLTVSGVTLTENGLKSVSDGTVLRSQACLIGNKSFLNTSNQTHKTYRKLKRKIENNLGLKTALLNKQVKKPRG